MELVLSERSNDMMLSILCLVAWVGNQFVVGFRNLCLQLVEDISGGHST